MAITITNIAAASVGKETKANTIGVLIPYYNERALLTRCLESLRAQTRKPDEILIYDDASTFPPEPYVPRGLTVKIVRGNRNQGPSYGRNLLLNLSRSEYVHFHDADDSLQPDWCRAVCQTMAESHADVIFTEIFLAHAHRTYERAAGVDRLLREADLVRFSIHTNLCVAMSTYRKEKLQSIGGFNEQMRNAEDFDLHLRLALNDACYAVRTEPLVTFNRHAASLARQKLIKNSRGIINAAAVLAELLPLRYHNDLAQKVTDEGLYLLLRLGSMTGALEAFRLAQKLKNKQPFHRLLFMALAGKLRRKLSCLYALS